MKKSITLALLLCFYATSFARHLKGGWIQYEYIGTGAITGTSQYKVTVYLFVSCTTTGPTQQVILGVFDAVTHASVSTQTIRNTAENTVTKKTFDACLSDPPSICYMIYTYVTTLQLADNANGYVLTVQDALRVDGIVNINGSVNDGITITASIPGTINGADYHVNTSPYFVFKDTAVICYNAPFTYQFSATDADGDSLAYSFGNGLNVTNPSQNTSSQSPASPPYPALTYSTGYSGASPMGTAVTINAITGIISGTAPATTGPYVIAVYVEEWRNGVLINTTKKELQIEVANCSLTGASLNPVYINCDNFTFTFQNESTSSNIAYYLWNFGVANTTSDTSTQATPVYTYKDTGTYTLKLVVSNTGGCTDSATASVKVYPGFTPGFNVSGSCYQSKFQFTDESYAKYGSINTWSWNFGDNTTSADTSSSQNPSWLYSSPGNVTVTLAVNSTKGCSGTVSKTVVVNDKPTIYLPFTDTLICSNDTLPLSVTSSGNVFSWGPAYNIINSNTASPKVYPYDTTVYTITVQDKGCIDSATVTVNVLPFITVSLNADTAICSTDSVMLQPVSYALSYLWTESGTSHTLNNYNVKYPSASPQVTTTYYVKANLGHCQDSAQTTVYVSPYPTATVSGDTGICYGRAVRLRASTASAYWAWSPLSSLYQANTLTPLAGPQETTTYYFTIQDTFYCHKTVTDSIIVTVIPPVKVNAGNDTFAVINQPVQLSATSNNSSVNYTWTPAQYINNTHVYNPVVTVISSSVDSVTYVVTATTPEGCYGYDSITVKIFMTAPDIFIPTAFTPNGDGTNDVLMPVVAGITTFNFFRIYNRWGQLIFETSQTGVGWNGMYNGAKQPSGTYVFVARGIDYLQHVVFKKGTVVLIR
ncbi:MAG TPA: PKD domain-containing protein [Chitinophagaceae bacterium]|nr:PKD domain-containing protein [Chitinophagaceae bacterium]